MVDILGLEFDQLSDREFRTLIEEAYSTSSSSSSSIMQLVQGLSSHGTSSPGTETPPSSDGQEEVHSPDHDSHAFAQVTPMTSLISHMGPTLTDLNGFNMNHLENTDNDQPFQNPYVDASSSTHPYTLYQLSRQSPVPSYQYILGDLSREPTDHGVGLDQNFIWSEEVSFQTPSAGSWRPTPHTASNPQNVGPFPFTNGPSQIPAAASVTDQEYVSQVGSLLPNIQHTATMVYRTPRSFRDVSPTQTRSRVGATPSERGHTRQKNQLRDDISPYPSTLLVNVGQARTARTSQPAPHPVLQPGPAPAPEQRYGPVSPTDSSGSSSLKEVKKGGRTKGLNIETREHANAMRKLGVCWICAFQRDKCDSGEPCDRCAFRSQRGQQHLLKCVRIHLQELVTKFLPPNMNRQHRRADTISFVERNLGYWRDGSSIQVYLTSHGLGYFAWDLHEFEPSSQDLLYQTRYLIGDTGTWQPVIKRSPPLALKEVNYSQTHKLEAYVENIIDACLEDFQQEAYSEEEASQAMFQTELLRALCSLYTSLPEEASDKNLKGDLRQVLKMLVLTYIMDHAVTILPSYQDSVISRMQCYNDPSEYKDWTSPMMANRQLKYFFSEMQTAQYAKSLNRLHQILRTAADKNRRWMSSFVLMLGIALVLEQCQHLLWVKADNLIQRGERQRHEAHFATRKDCSDIDDAFDFLCKLYHCKYRGKHRQKTRFEEWSSTVFHPAEAEFAEKVLEIVDRNGGYLMQRLSQSPSGMAENSYASRLVARFLVELMGLDRLSSSP